MKYQERKDLANDIAQKILAGQSNTEVNDYLRSIDIASYDIDKIIFEAKNALAYDLSEKVNAEYDIDSTIETLGSTIHPFYREEIKKKFKNELNTKYQNKVRRLLLDGNKLEDIREQIPSSIISTNYIKNKNESVYSEMEKIETNGSFLSRGVMLLLILMFGFFILLFFDGSTTGGIDDGDLFTFIGIGIMLLSIKIFLILTAVKSFGSIRNKEKNKKNFEKKEDVY